MANIILEDLRLTEPFSNLAAAKAFDFTPVSSGVLSLIIGLGFFKYDPTSAAVADDINVIQPTVGGGRLLRITSNFLEVNGAGDILGTNIDLSTLDHNALQNLPTGDVHTQYAFLAGRAGGQTLTGGTAPGDNLVLSTTSDATKGLVQIGGADGVNIVDENSVVIGGTDNTVPVNGSSDPVKLLIQDESNSAACVCAIKSVDQVAGAILGGGKSRGTLASKTIVQNGDQLLIEASIGYDGTEFHNATLIMHQVEGTPGVGDMPTSITFFTRNQGAAFPAPGYKINIDQSSTLFGNINFSANTFAGLNANPMTTGARDLLTPANGAIIYNETTDKLQGREAGVWQDLSGGGGGTDEFVKVTGADTTTGFLNDKVAAGTGVTKTTLNPGANEQLELSVNASAVDHNSLSNLAVGDVHTQYVFSAGRSGGQTVIGGTDADDTLFFTSTSSATKGDIAWGVGTTGLFYDEDSNLLSFGDATFSYSLDGGTKNVLANVADDGGNTRATMVMRKASNEAEGGEVLGLKSRGTFASPTLPSNGDVGFKSSGAYWDGSEFLTASSAAHILLSIGAGSVSGRYDIRTRSAGLGNTNDLRVSVNEAALKTEGIPIVMSPIATPPTSAGNGITYVDSTTNNLTFKDTSGTVTDLVVGTGGTDEFVKVSATDTTAAFLNDKIVAGTGITKNTLNSPGNEQIELKVPELFTTEVGPTSEFSDVSLAIAAGHTDILVVGDTVESGDWILPASETLVWIKPGVTVDANTRRCIFQAGSIFFGEGTGTVTSALTGVDGFFDNTPNVANAILFLTNWRPINTSTNVSQSFIKNITHRLKNVHITTPNRLRGAIQTGTQFSSELIDCKIIGTGTSSERSIDILGPLVAVNTILEGSFITAAFGTAVAFGSAVSSIINGVYFNINDANDYKLLANGAVSNIAHASNLGGGVTLQINGDNSQVTQAQLGGTGTVASLEVSANGCEIVNVNGNGPLASISGDFNQFSNCRFKDQTSTTFINGDGNKFIGANIASEIVVTGDDTTIMGGQIGPDGGTTSNSITVQLGAQNTLINGVRTDEPISNNDPSTIIIGNIPH